MTNKELISQYVDTGLQLPEYQIRQLSNNLKQTYIRKRLIAANQDSAHYGISGFEFLLMPDNMKNEFINRANSTDIDRLLDEKKLTQEKIDEVIEIIINNIAFPKRINDLLHPILYSTSNQNGRYELIFKILSNDENINNIDYSTMGVLLRDSDNPDIVIDKLFKNDQFKSTININKSYLLLKYTRNPIGILKRIGNPLIELIKNLNRRETAKLIDEHDNYEDLYKILIKYNPSLLIILLTDSSGNKGTRLSFIFNTFQNQIKKFSHSELVKIIKQTNTGAIDMIIELKKIGVFMIRINYLNSLQIY